MKKVENLNKILDIIKSDKLADERLDFVNKYSMDISVLASCLNVNFAKWLKNEVDIKGFASLIIGSKIKFDVDKYSIWDVIIEYLKIHLPHFLDLIDENIEDLVNNILEFKKQTEEMDLKLGSRHYSPELSDSVFNPFDNPELIIDEIINIFEIKFKGEEYRDRFYDVCIKFIKNLRNKFQTFDIFVKDIKNNGIGLEKNIADEVIFKIEEIKRDQEDHLLEVKKIELLNNEVVGKVEKQSPVISKQLENRNIEKDKKEFGDANEKIVIQEYDEGEMHFHVFEGSVEEMYLNQIKNKEEVQDMSDKDSVFKKNVKLVGPIDELRLFTIKDFRNLSSNVKQRGVKIEQKIKVLESYSARKKILGIKAWLNSEVCLVYKKMIDESVKYDGMSNVINMRKNADNLYLTDEEVAVIAELNRRLRI